MDSSNNIFNYNTTFNQSNHSFNYDRVDLIDETLVKDFNRYDVNVFYGLTEPLQAKEGSVDLTEQNLRLPSLFNHVNSVGAGTNMQVKYNAPLMDSPATRDQIRSYGDCSIKSLVDLSSKGMMGRQTYQYSDFMFCKHLGKVSNNYLITLRRFPFPCADHINYTLKNSSYEKKTQQHMPDIGRMVTWIGTPGNEMSNILKYDFKMPFEELEAKLQDANTAGDDGGILGTLANMGHNKQYNQMVQQGIAGASAQKYFRMATGKLAGLTNSTNTFAKGAGYFGKGLDFINNNPPPYRGSDWWNAKDANKMYGPINTINKTTIQSDKGLDFNQSITLTFDYELRSFNGINGKAAFLDLLANILATTYTTGNFWGGGIRETGVSQSNIFSNLPIFHLGDSKNQPLTPAKLGNAFLDSISGMGKAMNGGNDIKSPGDVLNMLKNMGSALGNMLLGGAINMLGRPHKQALSSLLSPAATGLWHLTVGNPLHPIMMMGDMILDSTVIEHYGPLGLDDFPTGIKVTCTLKHSKPRDITRIEQMYLGGDFRIYSPMSGYMLKMYENAYTVKKQKDNTQNNNDQVKARVAQDNTQTSIDSTEQAPAKKIDAQKYDEFSKKEPMLERILMQSFGLRNARELILTSKEAAWGADPSGKGLEKKEKEELLNSVKAAEESELNNAVYTGFDEDLNINENEETF